VNMTIFEGYSTGIFPLDHEAIKIYLEYEDGLIDHETYENILLDKSRYLIELQSKLGFTYISDPQLLWRNLLEPIYYLKGVKKYNPVNLGGDIIYSIRIVDDVRYFRGLINEFIFEELRKTSEKWKITILGPYTFYNLIVNSIVNRENVVREIYNGLLDEIAESGYDTVDIHEPIFAFSSNIDRNLLKRIYRNLDVYDIEFNIYTYDADTSIYIGLFSQFNIKGLSIDTRYIDIWRLYPIPIDRIIVGCIDSSDVYIEEPAKTINNLKKLSKKIRFKFIGVSFNKSPHILPYKEFIEKLRVLGLILKEVTR